MINEKRLCDVLAALPGNSKELQRRTGMPLRTVQWYLNLLLYAGVAMRTDKLPFVYSRHARGRKEGRS